MPLARPRRVLVCPQEFKGTLTAFEATEAIASAVRAALPDVDVIEQPMADGGPGTAELIGRSRGARMVRMTVADAYGAPTEAEFAFVEELRLAVIDSAAAVSLARTDPSRRAPLRSTSRGVGELIRAAADLGARGIILGVGGTASSDGGAGAAAALGLRLLDASAATLPDQAIHLVRLARVEDDVAPSLRGIAVRIAVDVQNRLTGADGAAAVYGAQKGLQSWEAPALDAAMRAWAGRVRADLGREIEHVPGAGAGGGIPAGILAALPGASIESGAALVAEAVGLRDRIAAADLVITGEGSLDAQTAFGKAVGHVASLAAEMGTPCVAVAGVIDALPASMLHAEPLVRGGDDPTAAIAEPRPHLEAATKRLLARVIDADRA